MGLVDEGLNSYLFHWVNGKFYTSFNIGRFCDGLKILLMSENLFLVWVSCFKENAKRPLMILYNSEDKNWTTCVLNSKQLSFDFRDFSYSRLSAKSDDFLLYIKDANKDKILEAQVSIDSTKCPSGEQMMSGE